MFSYYTACKEYCTSAVCAPPVLVALTSIVLEPSWLNVIVAKSVDPVFVTAYTDPNAVVPLWTTTAFCTEYSVFAASVIVINNSADLYDAWLKLMIVVAVDSNDTDEVCVLATPLDANAVLSKPVKANILAPLCGAEVNVIVVHDTV